MPINYTKLKDFTFVVAVSEFCEDMDLRAKILALNENIFWLQTDILEYMAFSAYMTGNIRHMRTHTHRQIRLF